MMQMIVNGQSEDHAVDTVAELLDALELGDAKVAVALNGEFVPASQRGTQRLAAGDRIEVVAPMQGG